MQTNMNMRSDENLSMFNKPRTISERLAEAAKSNFVGRKTEQALITNAVAAAELPFMVAYIHGPGGIGKSRRLRTKRNSRRVEFVCGGTLIRIRCREATQ